MADSTANWSDAKSTDTKRPKKFPLTPRKGENRWCKRVRGELHYFTGNADEALREWLRVKDALENGLPYPPKSVPQYAEDESGGKLTIRGLGNKFLAFKRDQVKAGELSVQTFDRYKRMTDLLVKTFGANRIVETLQPHDFQRLRRIMSRRWGVFARANEIQMVRTAFKFVYEQDLIKSPVKFGQGFQKPKAKDLQAARLANGPRLFTPEQIHACIAAAGDNMTAMILLAINGGHSPADLATLTPKAFDLKAGWLDYPRAKTAVARRIPLWKETVKAVKKVAATRPDPAARLFVGPRGADYFGNGKKSYRVTQEFKRVAKAAKVEGRTFYDLRRTFQTIGEGSRDLTAVQSIMGHAPASADMSAIYRQRVEDERLQAVVNVVRKWLFAASK